LSFSPANAVREEKRARARTVFFMRGIERGLRMIKAAVRISEKLDWDVPSLFRPRLA
jgi:hypothetical protein